MKVELKINNTSKIVYPYIVARRADDGLLWYWGAYSDYSAALAAAVAIGNGFVVKTLEVADV